MQLWAKWAILIGVYLGVILLIECGGRVYLVWGGLPWNSTLAMYQNHDSLGYAPNPYFSLDTYRNQLDGLPLRPRISF